MVIFYFLVNPYGLYTLIWTHGQAPTWSGKPARIRMNHFLHNARSNADHTAAVKVARLLMHADRHKA